MNQHLFKRLHTISNIIANVICKLGSVKAAPLKIARYSLAMFAVASITLPSAAHAQDANARAIMNSTHLLTFVDGVIPEGIPNVLKSLENGEIERLEPTFPVWIISSDTGNVLYYQGQKSFAGQSASRLVDDVGFRFGLSALENARKSKSSWVTLSLGGAKYSAYCATRAPFVVCSLIQ
jgi:hypothetical protein